MNFIWKYAFLIIQDLRFYVYYTEGHLSIVFNTLKICVVV